MARKMIDDITRDVRVGETYLGRWWGIQSFGAFIEILPGREGMVHHLRAGASPGCPRRRRGRRSVTR